MLSSTQQFIQALEAKTVKYEYIEEPGTGKDVVVLSVGGKNIPTMRVQIFFDSDCEGAAFRIFEVAKVPECKTAGMLSALNTLNYQYRFAKFVLNPKDSTIQAEADTAFRAHDVDAVCMELLSRILDICDTAYPELMRALWV